ncbi:nuclear transport factor 2 family protein [Streptomyces sp. NPDC047108]|uniref:nuclear transport factor 2 family protein n=1 Tax=Streptomyces sp. NPDC047108 TaxID=3155025 RepID=UPI0034081D64
MSGDKDRAELAAEFLAAFRDRDWDTLASLFAPDIVWSMPGDGTISGTAEGAAAAVGRAREIAGRGIRTELLHVLTGGHGVALILRNTATAGDGRTLDEHLATVLTMSEGKVTAIDSYLSDVPGMSAFFQ